jgi:hypothetical protein
MSPIINANLRKTCIENDKAEFELADTMWHQNNKMKFNRSSGVGDVIGQRSKKLAIKNKLCAICHKNKKLPMKKQNHTHTCYKNCKLQMPSCAMELAVAVEAINKIEIQRSHY